MSYDNEHFRRLARQAARKLLSHPSPHPIFTETTNLLDIGCGPGLLSQALAPHVGTVLGVDTAQPAVDAFNLSVQNQGIPSDEMRAVCLDLSEHELDGKFDVAVCSMTFHHIQDIRHFTRRVARVLAPGGWLFVVDHEEQCGHGRVHSPSEVVAAFEGAGFEGVTVDKGVFTVRMWVKEESVTGDTSGLEWRDKGGVREYGVKRDLMIVSGRMS